VRGREARERRGSGAASGRVSRGAEHRDDLTRYGLLTSTGHPTALMTNEHETSDPCLMHRARGCRG
jgi:hypothetical protein